MADKVLIIELGSSCENRLDFRKHTICIVLLWDNTLLNFVLVDSRGWPCLGSAWPGWYATPLLSFSACKSTPSQSPSPTKLWPACKMSGSPNHKMGTWLACKVNSICHLSDNAPLCHIIWHLWHLDAMFFLSGGWSSSLICPSSVAWRWSTPHWWGLFFYQSTNKDNEVDIEEK